MNYAFTDDECYFKIYSHVIRLLHKDHSILKTEKCKESTEQDFVGEVWTSLMSAIFNDPELYLKWGDSIPTISTLARKRLNDEEKMGGRVDLRVIIDVDGNSYDVVSTGKFVKGSLAPSKFSDYHQKVLRESKFILDNVTITHV